ncbi:MAG: hypothetical protein QGG53_41025, partial [Planctomycetota bacterium]|nr:hypothetical protein [Planctomycetota bacterium]
NLRGWRTAAEKRPFPGQTVPAGQENQETIGSHDGLSGAQMVPVDTLPLLDSMSVIQQFGLVFQLASNEG